MRLVCSGRKGPCREYEELIGTLLGGVPAVGAIWMLPAVSCPTASSVKCWPFVTSPQLGPQICQLNRAEYKMLPTS
eukprot:1142465-Pelagomonas_calceolata.AAC.6